MKTLTGFALGLAAALAVPAAFADDDTKTKTTTTDTSDVAPAAATTTTTTTDDFYIHEAKRDDKRARVRSGVGLNAFGAAGSKDTARLGVGGRLEFVMPFGLTFGASYTQHFTSEADRTAVRPLLGEIGWTFAVVRHVEVRPMVGLGYAFATGRNTSDTDNTGSSNQVASATGSTAASGFDVAPGAKVSFVDRSYEVFTQPK